MGEAVCELYGCGCEATKFGFARMCDSCYANVTKELREQIAREIEERIVERGENEPWDKDINVGLKEASAIARGEK